MNEKPISTRPPSDTESLLRTRFVEDIGDQAAQMNKPSLYLSFACWFLALLLTLISLIPRKWRVNPSILKQHSSQEPEELGIEDFFYKTAQYKCRFLIPFVLFFPLGFFSGFFCFLTMNPYKEL